LLPPARLHFLDGWYNPERNAETGEIWRWMGDEGVCHVGNLRRDVDVFIKGEIPREPFERPSTVTVLLQGKPIARFTPPYGDFSRRIRVPAIQLGESSAVIFVIQVDQTFRPVESGSGADSRILGLHLTDFQVVPRLSPFVEVPS